MQTRRTENLQSESSSKSDQQNRKKKTQTKPVERVSLLLPAGYHFSARQCQQELKGSVQVAAADLMQKEVRELVAVRAGQTQNRSLGTRCVWTKGKESKKSDMEGLDERERQRSAMGY